MAKISVRPLRGFTLIELVTTLLIIGILAAFAIGRLDFTSTFDQKAAHDKLLAGLQFARKAAVAERRYVCVQVAGNNAIFTIDPNVPENTAFAFGGTCPFGSALALPSPDKTCGGAVNAVCAPSGVTVTPSIATFQFDAQGRAFVDVTLNVTGQPSVLIGGGTGYVR